MWLCDLDTRNRCQVAFCLNLLIWLGCLAQQKTFVPSYKFCLPSIPLEWSWVEKVNVLDAQWGRGRYVHLEVTHLKRACWTALDSSAGYVESNQTLEVIPIQIWVACVDLSLHGRYLEKVARSALFLSHTSYHFHLYPSNVKSRIDLLSSK